MDEILFNEMVKKNRGGRRLQGRTAVAVLTLAVLICALGLRYSRSSAALGSVREDFEEGFGSWATDADVPLDPNNPGHPVEWSITRSSDVASSGKHSLRFFIDGRQDDGTIWIETKTAVQDKAKARVNLSFDFYSEWESFNTIAAVCAYAGPRDPKSEQDFVVVAPANEVAGWKRYSFTTDVDMGSSNELWVALGISVRWETYMTYYVDNVEVQIAVGQNFLACAVFSLGALAWRLRFISLPPA